MPLICFKKKKKIKRITVCHDTFRPIDSDINSIASTTNVNDFNRDTTRPINNDISSIASTTISNDLYKRNLEDASSVNSEAEEDLREIEVTEGIHLSSELNTNVQMISSASAEYDNVDDASQNVDSFTNMKTLLSYSLLSSPSDQSSQLTSSESVKDIVVKTRTASYINENSQCHEEVVENFEISHSPEDTTCESICLQNAENSEVTSSETSPRLIENLKPITNQNIGDLCNFSEPSPFVLEKENETLSADQISEAIKKVLIGKFMGDVVSQINNNIGFIPENSSTVIINEDKEIFNDRIDTINNGDVSNEEITVEIPKANTCPSLSIPKDEKDISIFLDDTKSTFVNPEVLSGEELHEKTSEEFDLLKEMENESTISLKNEIYCEELLDGNQDAFNIETEHIILTTEVDECAVLSEDLYENRIGNDLESDANCNEIAQSLQFTSVENNSDANEGYNNCSNGNVSDSQSADHYCYNASSDIGKYSLLDIKNENVNISKEIELKSVNGSIQIDNYPENSDNSTKYLEYIYQTVGDLLRDKITEDNDVSKCQYIDSTNDPECGGDCVITILDSPSTKTIPCRLSATLENSLIKFSTTPGLEQSKDGHEISLKEKETHLNRDKLSNNVLLNSIKQEKIFRDNTESKTIEPHVTTVDDLENPSNADRMCNQKSSDVADSLIECKHLVKEKLHRKKKTIGKRKSLERKALKSLEKEKFLDDSIGTEISVSSICSIDELGKQDNNHQTCNITSSDDTDSISKWENAGNEKFLEGFVELNEEIQKDIKLIEDAQNDFDGVELNKNSIGEECETLINIVTDSSEKLYINNITSGVEENICLSNTNSSERLETEQYKDNAEICCLQHNQIMRESNEVKFNGTPMKSISNSFESDETEAVCIKNSFDNCSENGNSYPKEAPPVHTFEDKCSINSSFEVSAPRSAPEEGITVQKVNKSAINKDKIRTDIQNIILRAQNIVQIFKDLNYQKSSTESVLSKSSLFKKKHQGITSNVGSFSVKRNNLFQLSYESSMDDLLFDVESDSFSSESSPIVKSSTESCALQKPTYEHEPKIGHSALPLSLPLSRKNSDTNSLNLFSKQHSRSYFKDEYQKFCGVLNKFYDHENGYQEQIEDLDNSITYSRLDDQNVSTSLISQSEPTASNVICPTREPSDQGDIGIFANEVVSQSEIETNVSMGDSGIDNCCTQEATPEFETTTPKSKVTTDLSSRKPNVIVKCSGKLEVCMKETVLPKIVTSRESIIEVGQLAKNKNKACVKQHRNVKDSKTEGRHVQLFDKKKIENMIQKNLETFKTHKSDTLKPLSKATNVYHFSEAKKNPLNIKQSESQKSNSEKMLGSIPKKPNMKRGTIPATDSGNKSTARFQKVRTQSKPSTE